jgi:putative DNA methylase
MSKTHSNRLVAVALPLGATNAASAHEKQPGIGAHPRGLHLWWARRPLVACRAALGSRPNQQDT